MGCALSMRCGSDKTSRDSIIRQTVNYTSDEELEQINQVIGFQKIVDKTFIRNIWKEYMTANLMDIYEHFLFTYKYTDDFEVDSDTFALFYTNFVNGNSFDRLNIMMMMLENERGSRLILMEDFKQLIKSSLIMMDKKQLEQYVSWTKKGCSAEESTITKWVSFLIGMFERLLDSATTINEEQLHSWLTKNPEIVSIQCMLFSTLYNMGILESGIFLDVSPLPSVDFLHFTEKTFPFILDIPSIMFLNAHLPNECKENWRLLFSMEVNGESFSRFYTSIIHKGPTVLVVKDSYGYIFGAYASTDWHVSPKFYGNGRSFLFTISPELHIYNASYCNNNYQYLNVKQRTLLNGLGMGGQMGYVGLWIDASFEYGSSAASCVTFNNYNTLSKKEVFRINALEVWSVQNTSEYTAII